MFPNCTSTSETTKISVATFAPLEQIQSIIGMAESSKGEVFLCKSHYNEAYKCVNRVPCAVSQAYPNVANILIGIVLMLKPSAVFLE